MITIIIEEKVEVARSVDAFVQRHPLMFQVEDCLEPFLVVRDEAGEVQALGVAALTWHALLKVQALPSVERWLSKTEKLHRPS
jgi:hypothetical protein